MTAQHAEAVGPYAAAALLYRRADWTGVLPLPPGKKWPPPDGYSGGGGIDPSGADIQTWIDGTTIRYRDGDTWRTYDSRLGNIALRLPRDVVGIDVDDYAGKGGGATIADREAALGPLPSAWRTTSRDDGVSGIRLYRVPEGLWWPNGLGPGVEIVRYGHRYAASWPSTHPDTGATYRWVNPDGLTTLGDLPNPHRLVDLPDEWVQVVTGGRLAEDAPRAGLDGTEAGEWLDRHGDGSPCGRMLTALTTALEGFRSKAGARHDVALAATASVAHLVAEGHPGGRTIMGLLHDAFATATAGERRDPSEWERLAVGAVNVAACSTVAAGLGDPCLNPFDGLLVSPTPTAAPAAPVAAPTPPAPAPTSPAAPDPAPAPVEAAPVDPYAGLREQLFAQETERERARRRARRLLDDEDAAEQVASFDPSGSYLDVDGLASLPTPEPLIAGTLSRHTYTILRGRDGSFKTFVAIDWALCLATGKPWLGREVEPVRVLYVAGEGAYGLRGRIRAWERATGWAVPRETFTVRTSAVNLYRGGLAADELEARVRDGGYGLVVLDTLRRMSGGADANGSDMGIVVDRIAGIVAATDNGTVLTITHTDKGDNDSRGFSGIEDDADGVWHCKREEGSMLFTLTNRKFKDGPDGEELSLRCRPVQLDGEDSSLVVERAAHFDAVTEPEEGQAARLLDAVRENRYTGITAKRLIDDYNVPKTTVYRVLNRLGKDGIVDRKGAFYYVAEKSDSHAIPTSPAGQSHDGPTD